MVIDYYRKIKPLGELLLLQYTLQHLRVDSKGSLLIKRRSFFHLKIMQLAIDTHSPGRIQQIVFPQMLLVGK